MENDRLTEILHMAWIVFLFLFLGAMCSGPYYG